MFYFFLKYDDLAICVLLTNWKTKRFQRPKLNKFELLCPPTRPTFVIHDTGFNNEFVIWNIIKMIKQIFTVINQIMKCLSPFCQTYLVFGGFDNVIYSNFLYIKYKDVLNSNNTYHLGQHISTSSGLSALSKFHLRMKQNPNALSFTFETMHYSFFKSLIKQTNCNRSIGIYIQEYNIWQNKYLKIPIKFLNNCDLILHD